MVTIEDIDKLVTTFSSEYRRSELPAINKSEIYSLFSNKLKVPDAALHWPEMWPNCQERGVYAILSGATVLYIGKASQQDLGYRLGSYFVSDVDKQSAIPAKGHQWSQMPTSIVTWAVPRELFFEASALEEYLIHKLRDRLPDNTRGKRA
ncbi:MULTISPECIES: hypothetical protein [unclassified Arsukibacterium]|uniref:hypothetical protein n=1 Tax=unclassified Arsukibacterium TaxID=2635278 RepID=UPI000C615F28|nr:MULTISPECIES: hypothetical protein [unclassified Arsukibacterium]MAA93501.1 hypothetical protein [Rheinheimera sp.]MBM33013.1 hypothetical protein [Rheinheimera sp.]HAW92955.1 hypothetical protein [Candidatus Azambacteria bacterium]|tara:strand:+ start:119468 stop:119917 length:450 start_codon:yes stop_codon:yes gene_type:complete